MRYVLGVLGKVLALLLVVVVCVILFGLGPLVKMTLQSVTPAFLGAPVTMESLSINPVKGTLLLKDFRIGNYERFNQPDLLRVKELRIKMDMGSLFQETIVVNSVEIDQPLFAYEQDGITDNISELLANIAANMASKEENGLEQYDEPSKKSAKKVVVKQFQVTGGSVVVANTKRPLLDIALAFDRVQLSMSEGRVAVNGLSVSNPSGFVTKHVFELPMFGVSIDPESIYSNRIVIKDILFDSPSLFLEKGADATNVDQLMKLVAEMTPRFEKPPKEPESLLKMEPEEGELEEKVSVVVEQVRLGGFALNMLNSSEGEIQVLEEILSVTDVSIRPEEGALQVAGVYVLSPNGFVSTAIFGLKTLNVLVDPVSLLTEHIVVNQIDVSAPHITLEQNQDASNLAALMQRIEWFVPAEKSAEGKKATKKKEEPSAPAPSVWLESLVVDDFEVKTLRSGHSASPQKASPLMGVRQVRFSAAESVASVNEVYVRNPSGYSTPNLFELSGVNVDFDAASFGSTQLVVKAVQVAPIRVNLEQTPSSANLAELMTFFDSVIPKKEAPAAPSNKSIRNRRNVEEKKSNPVVVQRIGFEGGVVQLVSMPSADASKTEVKLAGFDEISIIPYRGLIDVSGLFVGNPQQFVAEKIFQLESLKVKIDPATLSSAPLVIKGVLVKNPIIALERTPDGLNLPVLIKMIEGVLPPPSETEAVVKVESATPSPVLQRFAVEGAKLMVVHAPNPGDSMDAAKFVGVEKLALQMEEGYLSVSNIYVANPREFTNPAMLEMGSLNVSIDPESMDSSVLMVPEILVEDLLVSYERQMMTDNIKVLQERVGAFFALEEVGAPEEERPVEVEATPEEAQKVIIGHLLVRNGAILAKFSALPTATIPLSIELTDIGKDTGGAGMVELYTQLFGIFYQSILGAVTGVTGMGGDLLKGSGTLVEGALTDPGGTLLDTGGTLLETSTSLLDLGLDITDSAANFLKIPQTKADKDAKKEDKAAE